MKEISFEMATELGLIPKPTNNTRLYTLPFESHYALDKHNEVAELGFRASLQRIKEQYQFVNYNGQKLKVV